METRILNSLSLYPKATSPFLLRAKMACRFSVENQFYWRQGIGEIVSRNSDGGEQQSPESRRPGTSFPVFPFFFSLCSSLLAFYDPNAWSRLAKISHFKLNFKLFTLTWLNTVVKGHYLPGLSIN